MLIDSHCHLDFPELFDHIDDEIRQMHANHVRIALCAGVTMEDFPKLFNLAKKHPMLFAAVGVHPEINDKEEARVEKLVALANHPKVLAIGETGLDYYWHKDKPEWQRARFRTHIDAAKIAQKPLIIHTRESASDILEIMESEKANAIGGVMHCFTEDKTVAKKALDLGFYISFSGIVTFKNAKIVHETAKYVPQDRLLVETDAPYLAPSPHRGKLCRPAYVLHVAEALALLRGESFEAISKVTSDNFARLFKMDLTPFME